MPRVFATPVKHYGAAVGLVIAAIAVRLALVPFMGAQLPFATLLVAILLTATYAGIGPALAAVALGALGARYFLLPPHGVFSMVLPDQQLGLMLYGAIGCSIALLVGGLRAARQRAQASADARQLAQEALKEANEQLSTRVRERTEELARSHASLLESTALLAIQKQVFEQIATGVGLPEVLDSLARSTEERLPGTLCSILLLEDDQLHLRVAAAPHLPAAIMARMNGLAIGSHAGSCGTAAFRKETVIAIDIGTDTRWTAYRDLALSHGLQACWSTPIFSAAGPVAPVLGSFALYAREVRAPDATFYAVVPHLARLAGVAIERKQADERLRESEERLRLVLRGSKDAPWDWNLTTGTNYRSRQWWDMLGHDVDETAAGLPLWLEFVHPDDLTRAKAVIDQAIATGAERYEFELRLRHKDGHYVPVHARAFILRDASGRAVRLSGVNTDLTERQRAEAERLALEAQLRTSQKMESIGTLAGGIAHDFNNVLGSILGNVALAREDIAPDHAAQMSLEQIHRASLRARALVQQILAFSRHQTQALVNQPLLPLVKETLTMLRAALPAGVRLEAHFGLLHENDLHVLADATQIQQVLMNLCTNAWQALQDKPGTIDIALDEVQVAQHATGPLQGLAPGGYAHVSVTDTGSGMDDATRARVFEPFFTTKPVGQGTGLGLSVAHGIVTAHHGRIGVDSVVGRGSTFHVYLPVVDASAAEPSHKRAEPETLRGAGQRILVLDDDEVMLLTVQRLLQRLGYQPQCFLAPDEAMAALQTQPNAYALILTDFNMPRISGVDIARSVARLRPDLPVVISSGYINDSLRADAAAAGVRNLVQKERTLEELPGLLHSLLPTPNPH